MHLFLSRNSLNQHGLFNGWWYFSQFWLGSQLFNAYFWSRFLWFWTFVINDNVSDQEIIDELDRVEWEIYSPITEDITIDDETLAKCVAEIEKE